MGKVLLRNGYRVTINTNDHAPPHVHVLKNNGVIVVHLNGRNGDEAGVLWIRETRGLSVREAREAMEIVRENFDLCAAKWREIHGE